MAINKVVYGADTLLDLTEDTVTEDTVLKGETFHDRSGVSRTGNVNVPVPEDITVVDEFISYNGGRVKSVQMELSPIQDLHGYSEPWVGGAKENIADFVDGYSISLEGEVIEYAGRCATVNPITIEANTTYYVKRFNTVDSGKFIYAVYNGSTVVRRVSNIDNNSALNTSGGDKLYVCAYDGTIDVLKPMVTKNTLPTAYSPYSNKCPISGHTQAKLEQRGKNYLNSTLEDKTASGITYTKLSDGIYNVNGTSTTNGGADFAQNITLQAGTYKILGLPNSVASNSRYIGLLKDGAYYATSREDSFTLTETTTFESLRFRAGSGNSFDNVIVKPMITKDLSATYDDFEPYQGKDYIINLGGTYYWLRGDVVSGKWYVVGVYTTITSFSGKSSSTSNNAFYKNISDILRIQPTDIPNLISDKYIATPYNTVTSTNNKTGMGVNQYGNIVIGFGIESDIDTLEEANAWATANPIELVYELATPVELDLTPQQILAIIGENHFSAPLEQQEIIEIIARNIAEFNEVIDDENISEDFTYSSEKIEDRLEDFVNKDAVEEKSATDFFETINGGLLSSLKVALTPNQDLHGYAEPWVGGASKNKMPLTVENLKAWNTSGTWSGNTYSYGGMDFTILTDDDNNVIDIDENGATSSYPTFKIFSGTLNGSYRLCRDNARSRVYVNSSQVDDGTSDYSFTASGETYDINLFTGAVTLNHKIVKPMLVLSTETDFNFEPYSNICPITGHTEVDIDVSDGDTTQEQVTVNLGGTYYSGTLEVVSGVFVVEKQSYTITSFTGKGTSTQSDMYGTNVLKDLILKPAANSDIIPCISDGFVADVSYQYAYNNHTLGKIAVNTSGSLYVTLDIATLADANTWVANNPIQVIYPLANPTPIQLSPTMVKALVGENHLFAPLEGQEITESKYRELFTWDEVEEIAQKIADSKIYDRNVSSETTFSSYTINNLYARKIYDVPVVTPSSYKAVGATEVTFSNPNIFSDLQTCCELIQLGSGPRVGIANIAIGLMSVTFTFDAPLTEATRFRCRITNEYYS